MPRLEAAAKRAWRDLVLFQNTAERKVGGPAGVRGASDTSFSVDLAGFGTRPHPKSRTRTTGSFRKLLSPQVVTDNGSQFTAAACSAAVYLRASSAIVLKAAGRSAGRTVVLGTLTTRARWTPSSVAPARAHGSLRHASAQPWS